MHPVLLDLGGFRLHSYGALGALGFLLACWAGLRFTGRRGLPQNAVVDVVFWTSLAAIGGSRLMFLVQNPGSFDLVNMFNLRTGGMVFYGAPILGLPVFVGMIRRHGLSMGEMLDGLGFTAPLAHAFARLGCLGAGCCWGSPTDLPWAVTYADPLAPGPHGVGLHPVQAYEAIGLFALSAFLWSRVDRPHKPGAIFAGWIGLYAVLRITTEVGRGDAERGFIGPLSTSQAISIGALLAVAAWAWSARARPDEG